MLFLSPGESRDATVDLKTFANALERAGFFREVEKNKKETAAPFLLGLPVFDEQRPRKAIKPPCSSLQCLHVIGDDS